MKHPVYSTYNTDRTQKFIRTTPKNRCSVFALRFVVVLWCPFFETCYRFKSALRLFMVCSACAIYFLIYFTHTVYIWNWVVRTSLFSVRYKFAWGKSWFGQGTANQLWGEPQSYMTSESIIIRFGFCKIVSGRYSKIFIQAFPLLLKCCGS